MIVISYKLYVFVYNNKHFVGREGFEPPNNEDLIYSQAQLTTLPPTQIKNP